MNAFITKRNVAFVFTILFLILIMVYTNFLMPMMEDRDDLTKQKEQKQSELIALRKQQQSMNTVTPKIQFDLGRLRKAIPEEPRKEELLRLLRMLEETAKIDFSSYKFVDEGSAITPSAQASTVDPASTTADNPNPADQAPAPATMPEQVKRIQMEVSFKGYYSKLLTFLSEVQTYDRMIRVDKLDIHVPTPITDRMVEVDVQATIVAYYVPELGHVFKNKVPIDYTKPEGRENPLY